MAGVVICSAILGWIYGEFLKSHDDRLHADHPHKPIPTYKKWENDETRDILKVLIKKFHLPAIIYASDYYMTILT